MVTIVELKDLTGGLAEAIDEELANPFLGAVATMSDVNVMLTSNPFHPLHCYYRLHAMLAVTRHDGNLVLLKKLGAPEDITDSGDGSCRDKGTQAIRYIHVQLANLLTAQTQDCKGYPAVGIHLLLDVVLFVLLLSIFAVPFQEGRLVTFR